MIFDLIFKGLIWLGAFLMNFLPKLNVHLPEGLLNTVQSIFSGIGYFLPMNTFATILTIQFGYLIFKAVYQMISEFREWTPGI